MPTLQPEQFDITQLQTATPTTLENPTWETCAQWCGTAQYSFQFNEIMLGLAIPVLSFLGFCFLKYLLTNPTKFNPEKYQTYLSWTLWIMQSSFILYAVWFFYQRYFGILK